MSNFLAFSSKNLSSRKNFFVLIAAFVALTLCLAPSNGVEARPSEGVPEQGDVQDFLKYMEELDQMYNKFARPSSPNQAWYSRQRRVGINSAIEKLSQIKNYYNEAGRPRFGKRSGYNPEMYLQQEKLWK